MGPLHANTPLARSARSVAYLINLRSLVMCVLGCLAVWAAERWGLVFSLDISVVVFGVTFSVTFTITQAYQRRERALVAMAELKASVVCLYWMHRDWPQDYHYPDGSLGNGATPWAREFASVASDFLLAVQAFLTTKEGYESMSEVKMAAKRRATTSLLLGDETLSRDELGLSFVQRVQDISQSLPGHRHLMRAYAALSRISVMNEYLTFKSGYTRGGEGGMSRSCQYHRYLVSQMEQLRMIKIYRTPAMLRHACTALVAMLTVLLAPYFVHAGRCEAGFPVDWCPAPYLISCLWVMVTTLLLHVQDVGEHPLDAQGVDDIFFELPDEFQDVISNAPSSTAFHEGSACFDAWRQKHTPTKA